MNKLYSYLQDYIPSSYTCFKEGYTPSKIFSDLMAGVTVGIIALPLAMAFAIGSGVTPEQGLYTAIIAGFLVSLLGGSRVQIGGPTGAFVIIVFGVIQRHGYEGLAIATLMAGVMLVLMGIFRCGIILKFIPPAVITGFTTGIALIIFTSQVKDFLGLKIDSIPPSFIDKWVCYGNHLWTCQPWALFIALGGLILIFVLRHYFPKVPGVIIAIILGTIATQWLQLPIETIETKFGSIPRTLPIPAIPFITWEKIQILFPEAIVIALLGAIESLLSAVVADKMSGFKHLSNCELVAQGFANIGSIFFGGIPATGAIARTTANIKMGAQSPLAGMTHAVTLALLMLLFAPMAAKVPLAGLAAVLVFVSWNMSELPHFIQLLRGQWNQALVLSITFLLTVLSDLTIAVITGVVLAPICDRISVAIQNKDIQDRAR